MFLSYATIFEGSDMLLSRFHLRLNGTSFADEVALDSESRITPLKNEKKKLFNDLVSVKGYYAGYSKRKLLRRLSRFVNLIDYYIPTLLTVFWDTIFLP